MFAKTLMVFLGWEGTGLCWSVVIVLTLEIWTREERKGKRVNLRWK